MAIRTFHPRRLLLAFVTITVVLATEPAQSQVSSCGATITTSTTLSTDLICPTGYGLHIGANGITLDLNGHTIAGGGSAVGIVNVFPSFHDVVITNGTIQRFTVGISMATTRGVTVRDVTVLDNTRYGMLLKDFDLGVIIGNHVFGSGASGIVLTEGSDATLVSSNWASANRGRGIWHDGGYFTEIRRSRTMNNGAAGIRVDSGTVGPEVVRNKAHDNGATGILVLSTGAEVERNRANGNHFDGITVLNGARDTLVSRNRTSANEYDGIHVEPKAEGNVLQHNSANVNGFDGIGVESRDTTITGSEAYLNSELGIRAVAGVTDGGGNVASGNGNPAQCLNVVC
jgi:hypothetical protein